MKTNFFENITSLNAPGIWKIGIQNDANGHFVVSVLYSPDNSNEPALKTIAPLIFKGTVAEMDEGFFEAIGQPVQATAGLYSNATVWGVRTRYIIVLNLRDRASKSLKVYVLRVTRTGAGTTCNSVIRLAQDVLAAFNPFPEAFTYDQLRGRRQRYIMRGTIPP